MMDINDIIKKGKMFTPAKGGEKNNIISQFIPPLNTARSRQNARNWSIEKHAKPTLTKDEFRHSKLFLAPVAHSRIVLELKRAYGKWEDIKTSDLYELLSVCKQSDDFSWTFWGRLKKQRENRKKH